MSLNLSPKVVTDGLVMYYDIANPKSFIGAPTTNVQRNNGTEYQPWSYANAYNMDVTGTKEQGPISGATTWKMTKDGSAALWNGWENGSPAFTGSAGDYWTVSYWYKTSDPAGATSLSGLQFYLNDWSRAYNSTSISSVIGIIPDGQWHFNYATTRIDEAYTNAIIADGPSWYGSQSGTLYINGLQWEKKAYPTRFTQGTRTVTQGLKDLVGNTTADLTNAAYDSVGNIAFTGNGNYISTTSLGILNAYTICFFARRDTDGKMPIAAGSGTPYYWYGDSSWRYTHGGVGGEYYYPKPTTINAGSWGFYCVTYDGNSLVIYRNGIFQGSVATTGTADFTSGIWVGNWTAGGVYSWSGPIGTVKVYNRALSLAEVQQNFNALRGRYGI